MTARAVVAKAAPNTMVYPMCTQRWALTSRPIGWLHITKNSATRKRLVLDSAGALSLM